MSETDRSSSSPTLQRAPCQHTLDGNGPRYTASCCLYPYASTASIHHHQGATTTTITAAASTATAAAGRKNPCLSAVQSSSGCLVQQSANRRQVLRRLNPVELSLQRRLQGPRQVDEPQVESKPACFRETLVKGSLRPHPAERP